MVLHGLIWRIFSFISCMSCHWKATSDIVFIDRRVWIDSLAGTLVHDKLRNKED